MTNAQIQALIDAIETGQPNTALTVRTALNALGRHLTGMVFEMDVPTSYIASNFDGTGLGINEMTGYAICNGNNGTRNRNGKVPVGYDPSDYPTLGATGGSKTEVLLTSQIPSHRHLNGISNDNLNPFVYSGTTTGMPGSATAEIRDEGGSRIYQGYTATEGGGLPHNNMQPYIVTLFIMKL